MRIDKMYIYKMDDNITVEKNCHKITWLSHNGQHIEQQKTPETEEYILYDSLIRVDW